MFRSVYLKTIYNLRWQLIGWTIGIMAVGYLTMVLYTSFNQSGIENIINSVPDSLKSLVGNVADFKTVPGYVGQQIFGPNGYILTVIMAVLLAISISASEEDDGRLQSLLSMPLGRTKVFLHKWLALITVVTIVSLSMVVALYLGLWTINESADGWHVVQSTLEYTLLNITFASVTFAIAMFLGKKGLTIAVASVYTGLCLIISSLAPATDKLDVADKFSLLHYYNNPQTMQHGLDMKNVAVIATVAVVVSVVSWLRFARRNIST